MTDGPPRVLLSLKLYNNICIILAAVKFKNNASYAMSSH